MPRYSTTMECEAAAGFFQAARDGGPVDVANLMSDGGSLLAATFNKLWGAAINGYESGDLHGFAMMHSDIGVEKHWLTMLWEEMERVGADLISAVIPIKDARGLTSTAVDDTGTPWRVRRLTTSQVAALPVTFTDADIGGPLLLNTGLWLIRFGPWVFRNGAPPCFTIQDRIVRDRATGLWTNEVIPEDWDFSRQCRRLGLKLAATRRPKINHWGPKPFSNTQVWGWDHDQQNAPRKAPPQTTVVEAPQGFPQGFPDRTIVEPATRDHGFNGEHRNGQPHPRHDDPAACPLEGPPNGLGHHAA